VTAWRPIATAPKDGRHILLYQPEVAVQGVRYRYGVRFTGYYDENDRAWCATFSQWNGPFFEPTLWAPILNMPDPDAEGHAQEALP